MAMPNGKLNVDVVYEKVIEEFEAITRDAERVQRETLKEIIHRNSGTEYLRKWGVNEDTDAQQFTARVPLVTHADLEPYILRITDGDHSPILTAQPISVFSLSSGTTNGKPKFVPFTDYLLATTVQMYRISHAYRARDLNMWAALVAARGEAVKVSEAAVEEKDKEQTLVSLSLMHIDSILGAMNASYEQPMEQ